MTLRAITFDDEQWQVVPQELTGSMIDTINGHIDADSDAVALWRDALIDAPEPPAQQQDEQLPPYSAWLHVLDEAMVVRHLGVADPDDDYVTAQRKLNILMDWEIDVATDPAVGGDRVRKQQPITDEQIVNACYTYRHDFGLLPKLERHLLIAEARRWADAFGIGKGESDAD